MASASKSFIHDDFLLGSRAAKKLYHEHAEKQPIFDYHCHLSPADIASNRRFHNLWEIWLEGDHYKWRAMRTNGTPEKFCTGDAEPYDKFLAWACTVPHTLRNPLYHWTHLELKRHFGITELLDEKSAPRIWKQANEKLKSDRLTTHGILKQFRVKLVGTTDDPADSLAHHAAFASQHTGTRMTPTFRPDKALTVHQPEVFNAWIARLEAACNREIRWLDTLLEALKERHDFFDTLGCRATDHGLDHAYSDFPTHAEATSIFKAARAGKAASDEDRIRFASYIMLHVGRWNAEKGWVMQLHLGPLRNNNTRLFKAIGPDIGCDSIGDFPQARQLSRFLDRLDQENALPRTILYNLNPRDNYVFGTMCGNFQDGTIPGKIQFGSGWWFLDQKEGMEWQINALSNLGLLSRFVGMITDSRSFMSFPRHEYFRRTLCNLLGADIEAGLIPNDLPRVGAMVKNICYNNADAFFAGDRPSKLPKG
jgi:glucuronate isomerase